MVNLKCLTMFWIHFCLENCSVICTMILCYVLHQNPVTIRKISSIQNSSIFKTQHIFKTLSKIWDNFFFSKIIKNYNYFSKVLYLRSLTEFWIFPLNMYSLISRVTSSYVLYDTYSESIQKPVITNSHIVA